MCMGFDQPLDLESPILDEGDDLVGGFVADASGSVIDIHDAIDDSARIRLRILDDIADGIGLLVEEGGDLRLNREVIGVRCRTHCSLSLNFEAAFSAYD